MEREHISIAGLTGVDVTLQVAGPGTRAYAFVIDWHIRLLLATAWLLLGYFAYSGATRWVPATGTAASAVYGLGFVLPALLIYFLYHPLVELFMHGRTPGKRMAGTRLITRDGGIPSVGALLIRNLFRLIDSLPAFYVVGLVCTFFTAQRVRIGDLAAGTLLVLDSKVAPATLASLGAVTTGRFDPLALEVMHDLLTRWSSLDPAHRGALARAVLEKVDSSSRAQELRAADDATLRARLVALAQGGREP